LGIKSSHWINHSLIQKAMATDQYSQLRNYTKLDEVNSALATVTIANNLVETIKTELKEDAEMANQLCQAEDAYQNAQANAQSLADIANQCQGADKSKFEKQAKAAQKKAAQSQKTLQELQNQLNQTLPGAQQKIRQAIRQAENNALSDIKETAEMMESWGTEPGQLQQLQPEKRLELAQRLSASAKMKKLARLIGRFRRLAIHSQKTKIKHGYDEVYDLELGSDLNRLIPSELGLLRNPTTKLEFGRKFTEGKLMQYKLRGFEKAGKGPIICCIDGSGSMSGDREIWAKAVALGLLEIATMQKRAFASIQFGAKADNIKDEKYRDELVVTIQKDERNIIEKVIRIAEFFLNGGTDFESPLDKAVEILNDSQFKKADIVFITDGSCGVSEEWLQKFLQVKKEKEVRIHGIEIFGYSETLKLFCDQVTPVNELTGDDASQIFGGV
jgi:uncharacterized protein with von Willebrand factor type A (vWA) domain